jgi:putative aldouronate transport system permease protein
MAIPLAWLIVFRYIPMYGVQIAFRQFIASRGIGGSPWVGLAHFTAFFKSYQFQRVLWNTLGLSLYQVAASFPFPIVLALCLNEIPARRFQKTVQMVTYIPYFISSVVVASMVLQFLSPRSGIVTRIVELFVGGLGSTPLMGRPELFWTIYVVSGIWQHTGYQSIVYLAALAGVDVSLHEAAIVDGASRIQRIRHINIPGIAPTIVILLILSLGRIMGIGFEKVYLLQNGLNLRSSEVIATYVYKVGLLQANYSFSTAVGLFNSLVNLVLLVLVNQIAKSVGETSLW